jgi:hypothetical protein
MKAHRALTLTDKAIAECWFCGGKRWVQAADVYRSIGEEAQVDWETAAIVPCPVCGVQR